MERLLEVKVACGLHARPGLKLVERIKKYTSDIFIEKDGKSVDAKSLFAVVSLGISQGSVIKVTATGEDEEQALDEIETFIKNQEN